MKAFLTLTLNFVAQSALAEVCLSGFSGHMNPRGFLISQIEPKLEALGYEFVYKPNLCGKVETNLTIGAWDDRKPKATYLFSWQLLPNNAALNETFQIAHAFEVAELRGEIEANFAKLACRELDGAYFTTPAQERPFIQSGGVVNYIVAVENGQPFLANSSYILANFTIDTCEDK